MSRIADPWRVSFSPATRGIACDVAANAVREAWQQIEHVNPLPARTPNRRGAKGLATALESIASGAPNLKGMVQIFGLPRNVIEEVIGGAVLTAPMSTQPGTGVTAMNLEKRRQFNERFVQRLFCTSPQ